MRTRTLCASVIAAAPLLIFGCGTSSPSDPGTGSAGAGGALGGSGAPNTSGGSAGACSGLGASVMSCSGACIDTSNNAANCGMCGKACAAGSMCQGSQCACAAPLTACSAGCVNTQSDAANCGTCGNACPSTAPFCSAGACSATCAFTACGTACVNTMGNDPLNCGACGKACASGQSCANGSCGCPTGQSSCNGTCVDTTSSTSNCGACGMTCAAGQTCSSGVCSGGTGSGGAGGAGGAAGGGSGGSGGGGSTRPGGCPVAPGMISDFEEGPGTAVVIPSEGRTGKWAVFNDKSSTSETLTVETSGGTAACDKYALHVKGSGYADYVGFGMNFAGTEAAPTVYDGSTHQFTGIRFKAKAGSSADPKSPVRFNLSTPFTESSMNPGGKCNDATATCYQHLGKFLPPGSGENELSTTFKTYTFCFDRDLYPLSLPSNVTNAQRDMTASNLLKLQFQFNQGKDYSVFSKVSAYPEFARTLPFDLWIDDVSFFTGPCPNSTPSPSNGSPTKAFPQNGKLGTCAPATNAANFSSAIAQAYARWTKNFVRNDQVVSPEQNNAVTSEAMGYGMLIAAAMGDKTAFDKFYGYVKSHLGNGLMTWTTGQSGSATDADEDIAYALLMANAQWPSGGYKSAADAMISAILSQDIVGSVLTGGSAFHQAYNPSYFTPAWYRAFGSGFSSVTSKNYTFVTTNVTAPTSGVPTDWADVSSGNPSNSSGGAQVTSPIQDASGAMGYDAARVPWRLGTDACMGSTDTTALKAIVNLMASKYPSIDYMPAGFIKKNGAVHPSAQAMQASYIGSIGVGAMGAGNTAMRDRAFRTVLDILESGDFNQTYYPSTVGLLTLLAMAGDFPTL